MNNKRTSLFKSLEANKQAKIKLYAPTLKEIEQNNELTTRDLDPALLRKLIDEDLVVVTNVRVAITPDGVIAGILTLTQRARALVRSSEAESTVV